MSYAENVALIQRMTYDPPSGPSWYEIEQPKETKCGYCGDELLEDEETYCKECQIMHDEYMLSKRGEVDILNIFIQRKT